LDGDDVVDNQLEAIFGVLENYLTERKAGFYWSDSPVPFYHLWIVQEFTEPEPWRFFTREGCAWYQPDGSVVVQSCPESIAPQPLTGPWLPSHSIGPGSAILPVKVANSVTSFVPVVADDVQIWNDPATTELTSLHVAGGVAPDGLLLSALAASLTSAYAGAVAGKPLRLCLADYPPDGLGTSAVCSGPPDCGRCTATNAVSIGLCLCGDPTLNPADYSDLDLDGDGQFLADEVARSTVFAASLEPDVDLDADGVPESISFGVVVGLSEATFVGAP
jgi:hypothetical protein